MMVIRIPQFLILCGAAVCLAVTSCSKKESMDEIGMEMVVELEKLPESLKRFDSSDSEDSRGIEIAEMQMLSEALRDLTARTAEATPMSREVELAVNKRIKDVQDEVEFLLVQMQDKPSFVIRCSREIELISRHVHQLEQLMKPSEE
ncbi:hypothetical protein [Rubritalea marina]|uniref:hypothetical protein n=1 Tax=Rubritalea marina TaxID=361055 RepID=UPI000367377B|nr:hypothetical protein [Rubritalea marina]